MMRSMRAAAKWIMILVAGSFVAWMVFEVGMDLTGQSSGTLTSEVLRVNGKKIDLQTFYEAVRQVQERQRLSGGAIPVTLEDQRALEDEVVEQIVQDILLADEYRRRGIHITDDEIRQALLNIPPEDVRGIEQFQTDGQFDLSKYQAYLRSGADPGFTLGMEARFRAELPRYKPFEQLVEDVYISEAKLWRIYRDENETARVKAIVIFPAAVLRDPEISITEEEIRAYYEEHRADYRRPAVAYLSYIEVSRMPNAADSALALERAQAVKRELEGGVDFAEVAMRESADSVSRANGGDLGEVPNGTFVPEFERAARALRPGQISEPVLSQFGYHIIRLESKTDETFHASHVLIPIEPTGENLERMDRRADSLDLLLAERIDPLLFDSVAAQMELPVGTARPVVQGERVQAGPYLVPDAGLWAFEAVPGEISQVIEARSAYYVFRLDSLTPAGVPPLEEVRGRVVEAVANEKRWEATRNLARTISQEIRQGSSLQEVAEAHDLSVRELGPFTRVNPGPVMSEAPEAVGLAFGLPIGRAGGPVETKLAVFFVEPVERQAADSAQFSEQKEEMRMQLLRDAQQQRLQLAMTSLREMADVIDRRREVERAQQELADRYGNATSPLGFLR